MYPSTSWPLRRRLVVSTITAALFVALASCSSSPDEPKSDPPKPNTSKPKVTPTAPSPSVDSIELGKVEEVRTELHDEPDWLATGFGSVWTLRGNGSVVRLSSRGTVQAEIDPQMYQPPPCQGLGVSD